MTRRELPAAPPTALAAAVLLALTAVGCPGWSLRQTATPIVRRPPSAVRLRRRRAGRSEARNGCPAGSGLDATGGQRHERHVHPLRAPAGWVYDERVRAIRDSRKDVGGSMSMATTPDPEHQGRGWQEELTMAGGELVSRVQELVQESNVRRLILRHDDRILLEIPLTLGVVGTLLAPQVAALGALAALVTQCTLTVEREGPEPPRPSDTAADAAPPPEGR